MFDLREYRDTMCNLPDFVKEAELNAERAKSILIGFSNGDISKTNISDLTELYVRASNEKTGYVYTQNLSEDPYEILKRAIENSKYIERNNIDSLNSIKTSQNTKPYVEECSEDTQNVIKFCKKLEKKIIDEIEKITDVNIEVSIDTKESAVLNSKGVDTFSKVCIFRVFINVVSKYNNKSYNVDIKTTTPSLENVDMEKLIIQIVKGFENQYDPIGIKSGEYKVILNNTVVINILMTVWQIFSGRKYNEGSSVLSKKLGEIIGSDILNIVDVPSHKNTGYKFIFDCEGTKSRYNQLVKNGKFVGLMHNIESATANLDITTGNAGRYALLSGTIPTDIIIIPHVFHIEEGNKSIYELINQMDNGVYITESYDVFHSINIGSGDFSIPCRGVCIKDGKASYNVTGMTISGNIIDLFKNIVDIGDDLLIEEFLGKTYCVGSPSVLLKYMRINGE